MTTPARSDVREWLTAHCRDLLPWQLDVVEACHAAYVAGRPFCVTWSRGYGKRRAEQAFSQLVAEFGGSPLHREHGGEAVSERFRITDVHGADVYLEDAPPGDVPRVVLAVDPPDAPVPGSAYLDVAQAIAVRDALDAFIEGRFDEFIKQVGKDKP